MTNRRMRFQWLGLLVLLVALCGWLPVAQAQSSQIWLATATPFQISVAPDTQLGLRYSGGRQFFNTTASGLFVSVDNAVYGPSSISAGNAVRAYTPVANTFVGDGSAAAPWQITTSVGIGTSGLRLTSQLTYRNGTDVIDFRTQLENTSGVATNLRLYHAGDIFLEFPKNTPDFGWGTRRAATNGIGATTSTGDHAFLFEPMDPPAADAYQEAYYSDLWNVIGTANRPGSGFNNTFRTDYHDVAAGLQWNLRLAAGASTIIQHRLRLENVVLRPFSPDVDAPNIKNWGTPTPLSWDDFRETYGSAMVEWCLPSNLCVRRPEAELYYLLNFANEGEGGHCYGLAVMSALFYRGIYTAASFESTAIKPYDLATLTPALDRQVTIFHTFQNAVNIDREINASQQSSTPNAVYTFILNQLLANNLNPNILVIEGTIPSGTTQIWAGHALVPYDYERRPNGIVLINVYDSNHPGDRTRQVVFDTTNNTWSYDIGQKADGTIVTWRGTRNDYLIGLIPMSAHTGAKPAPPFGGSNALFQISGDYGATARVLVRDAQGRRIGSDGSQLYREIPNAVATPRYDSTARSGPVLALPNGTYQLNLTAALNTPAITKLDWHGSGYGIHLDNIGILPTSQENLQLKGAGDVITYQSNDPQKQISYQLAFSRTDSTIHGRTMTLSGLSVGNGATVQLTPDRLGDTLTLRSTSQRDSSYLLSLDTRDGERQTVFRTPMPLAAGVTYRINFGRTSATGTIELATDANNDGVYETTITLVSQTQVFLPLTQQ